MNKWNKYLIIGILILAIGKMIDLSHTLWIYVTLFIGLGFVIKGLIIFFKENKKPK